MQSPAPRTGSLAFRNNNMAPLLTPAHQRLMSINTSMIMSPLKASSGGEPLSSIDIDREKTKIARFLNTKERSGHVFAAREKRIESRIKEMEKKQKAFEKRKKVENKLNKTKVHEKQHEWFERRNKVQKE